MIGTIEKCIPPAVNPKARAHLDNLIDQAEKLKRAHPNNPCLAEALEAIEILALPYLRTIFRRD